jgi:hypothetical protein
VGFRVVYFPYSLILSASIAGYCKKVAVKDVKDEAEQVFHSLSRAQ